MLGAIEILVREWEEIALEEVRDLITDFRLQLEGAINYLTDANPRCHPDYDNLVDGARETLYTWLMDADHGGLAYRVGIYGLFTMYLEVDSWIADNNGQLPNDDREGEAIVEMWELRYLF